MRKSEKGITLISLVVTIIVLLLIAGISINAITGDNGLVNKSQEAKQVTKEAEIAENIKMAYSNAHVEKHAGSNFGISTLMQNELEAIYGIGNATVSDNGNGDYTITINGKMYNIDGTLKVAESNEDNNSNTQVGQDSTFSVTFNSNGGSQINNQVINSGEKITEPSEPTKDGGYIFDGWYKESNFENLWDFETDTVNENINLYAKWADAIYFQMPPDWSGNTVYVHLYSDSDSSIKNAPWHDTTTVMTLKDQSKKIYQYIFNSETDIENSNKYNKIIFSNDGVVDDNNYTARRTVALDFSTSDLRKVYVPHLYNSSGESRFFVYSTTMYLYLWKNGVANSANSGWPPSVQMQNDIIDGERTHMKVVNLSQYDMMILYQPSGEKQTDDINIPTNQDLTFKMLNSQRSNGHWRYSAFRYIYYGSWHSYDTWNDTEYTNWIQSGDGSKFQAAQTQFGY